MNLETQHEPIQDVPSLSVVMVREDLEGIPRFAMPEGYSVQWYEPGDKVHWMRIHLECEGYGALRPDLFWEQYGRDETVLAERVAFVCDGDGIPVSTNTAWMNDWRGERWGRIHWVATSREAQGKGSGKPLMTVVCERLRELGHDKAYLTTNVTRVRAIALYAAFGFKAVWETEEQREVWEGLIKRMKEIGRDVEVAI